MLVKLRVTDRMGVYLFELLDSGLYGKTLAEVVERLAAEQLRQKIAEVRRIRGVRQRQPRE